MNEDEPIYPYIPRLNRNGMENNPYWYSMNPFYQSGYGLPNCTCYAWGRWWENSDVDHDYSNRPNLCLYNAAEWYYYNDGYDRGQTPALGAVICFTGGYDGAGHVAVVEQIFDDHIVTSNSAYGGRYFYLATVTLSGYWVSGYNFVGYIYNPITGGGGQPVPIEEKKKPWLYKRELWNREEWLIR